PPRPPPFPYTTLFRSPADLKILAPKLVAELPRGDGIRPRMAVGGATLALRCRRSALTVFQPGSSFLRRAAAQVQTNLRPGTNQRSEEHTSELQSRFDL